MVQTDARRRVKGPRFGTREQGWIPLSRRILTLEALEPRLLLNAAGADEAAAAHSLLAAAPLSFVQNMGQIKEDFVRFAAYGEGMNVFHTTSGPVMEIFRLGEDGQAESCAFALTFVDASEVSPTGASPQEHVVNLFTGSDASQWTLGAPTFAQVAYRDLYPGIDLLTFGTPTDLKYEFHVAPGADPSVIQLRYDGVDSLYVDDAGCLHIVTGVGEVVDDAPVLYQEIAGERVAVAGAFLLLDDMTYTIAVTGDYDPAYPLIMDPRVEWGGVIYAPSSNSYGFWSEYLIGVTVDQDGNAYLIGQSSANDFPTYKGYDNTYNGLTDVFVTKISGAGALLWSTYLGGNDDDVAFGCAMDSQGNAFITGTTHSENFPVIGAVQGQRKGPQSGFLTKLTSYGAMAWSTFLGQNIVCYDVAVDRAGNAYVMADTSAPLTEFPGVPEDYKPKYTEDALISKISPAGSVIWTRFIENAGWGITYYNDIAVSANGQHIYVAGYYDYDGVGYFPLDGAFDSVHDTPASGWAHEGFIMKFGGDGSREWSSFIGGTGDDEVEDVTVDSAGNAILVGYTLASDFPGIANGYDKVRNGQDAFVAKVSPGGTLLWSTYLGGSSFERAYGVTVDALGNIYVTGGTGSEDFTTPNAFDRVLNGGGDPFIVKYTPNGVPVYASYIGTGTVNNYTSFIGGSGYGVGVDYRGNVFVGGRAGSLWDGKQWRMGHFLNKIVDTPYEWTILVYSNGDNNLEGVSLGNLQAMENVDLASLTKGQVKLFVQIDRHTAFDNTSVVPSPGTNGIWSDTRRGEVVYDGNNLFFATTLYPIETDPSELNTGDVAPLVDFVKWGMIAAPANHYMVVLHDHGNGWKGLSFDEDPDDSLTMAELAAVFDQLPYVDVTVMDMCMMQMVETQTELIGETGYLVAAEEVTYGGQLNYQGWLTWLAANPKAEPDALARQIFLADKNPVQSLVDMSEIPTLNARIDAFAATVLANATAQDWVELRLNRGFARHFTRDYYRDLGGFMNAIVYNKAVFSTPAIGTSAQAVLDAVNAAVMEHKDANTFGISIYLPPAGSAPVPEYAPNLVTFANPNDPDGTRWREFLFRLQGFALPAAPAADVGNAPAQALNVPAAAGVQALYDADIQSPSDTDFYSFTASAGHVLHASVFGDSSSGGLRPVLTVYAPNGTTILQQATGNANGEAAISGLTLAQGGTYYVAVSSAGNTNPLSPVAGDTSGPYTLALLRGTPAQVNPVLQFASATVAIGDAEMGAITGSDFVLTNAGGSELVITALTFPNGSVFEAPYHIIPLPASLAPGESINFGVAVTPIALGPVSDILHVLSNAPANPNAAFTVTAVGTEPSMTFNIGTGAASKVSYTDADGSTVTVTLKNGLASVKLIGTGLQQTGSDKKGYTVTGGNVRMDVITLAATDAKSALSFAVSKGDNLATLNRITGATPLGTLSGKGINLIGDGILLSGTGAVTTLTLNDVLNGADIVLPGDAGAKGATLAFRNLSDGSDVTLGSGLKSFSASEWLGGGLEALWASAVKITNTLAADLRLTGVDAKGFSLAALTVGGAMTDVDITLAGPAGAIKAGDWNGGALTAPWVTSLAVAGNKKIALAGDVRDVVVTLSGADAKGVGLGSAKIAGAMADSVLAVSRTLSSLAVGRFSAGSRVTVGALASNGIWFDGDDASSGLGARLGGFAAAAYDTDASGALFGIVADDVGSLKLGKLSIKTSALPYVEGDLRILTV